MKARHSGDGAAWKEGAWAAFVTHYLPVGLVGLVIGVIFSAAMSSISGEINSQATVSISVSCSGKWVSSTF